MEPVKIKIFWLNYETVSPKFAEVGMAFHKSFDAIIAGSKPQLDTIA